MGGPWRAERAVQRSRCRASRPADGYGPPVGRPLRGLGQPRVWAAL